MSSAYNPAAWSSFFSAQISASSALTGLIFVAISINLSQIVGRPQLIARCAKGLTILMGVLLASTFCMAPGQPVFVLGCEIVVLGAVVWIVATRTQITASHKNPYILRWQKVLHVVLTQFAVIPFIVGGVSLIAQRGGGLYWLLGGVLFSLVAALADAWVLLIEIQR
jgi:hypothetical protein